MDAWPIASVTAGRWTRPLVLTVAALTWSLVPVPGDVVDAAAQSRRLPTLDIELYEQAESDVVDLIPVSLWSDGTTMWVGDFSAGGLFAYDAADRTRTPGKDFLTTRTGSNYAHGEIWSDGTTMWKVLTRGGVQAFDMATHERDPARDISAETMRAAGNAAPYGLWSDGTTMYVTDSDDLKLYAYDLATRTHDPARDLDLDLVEPEEECCGPYLVGIWSDGTTMWAGDYIEGSGGARILQAHDLATGAPDPSKDIDITGAGGNCIWSDGTTMWLCEGAWPFGYNVGLIAFDLKTRTPDPAKNWVHWMLNPRSHSGDVMGDAFSDGTTMYVSNEAGPVLRLRSVDRGLQTGDERRFQDPRQICHGWLTSGGGPELVRRQHRVLAPQPDNFGSSSPCLRLADSDPSPRQGHRDSGLPLADAQSHRAVWSDGTTLWTLGEKLVREASGEERWHSGGVYLRSGDRHAFTRQGHGPDGTPPGGSQLRVLLR